MTESPARPSPAGPRPTTAEAAFARVADVERRLDLLRHTVAGWAAWPLLRFEIAWNYLAGVTHPQFQAVGRVERILGALADLPGLFPVKRARHLVKTYNTGLIDRDGDRFVDIWFDDVIRAAGSTFKVEMATSPSFRERSRRALVPRDASSALLEILSGVLARRQPPAEMVALAAQFGAIVRDELGLRDIDDAWVLTRLRHFAALKRVYGGLLDRVRPSYVLIADANELALTAAARERGVTVLDLQHGISDRTHAGYAWTDYARPYRGRMAVPDRLLLYGEHWRRELDAGGFWGDALRVVGSPRLDRYRAIPPSRPGDACAILFTTQGLEVPAVIGYLQAFLEGVSVPVRLSIRLHPIYDPDPRVYAEPLARYGARVEVVAGHEEPSTFERLRRAHLHLSVSSACHYDALGLGVPTVVLPFHSHEVVLPLVAAGHAQVARTPADLASLVSTWRDLALPAGVSEYYFAPGARAGILREMGLPA